MAVADVDELLLEEMLEWTPARQVGRKWTRMCHDLTDDFWDLWRDYKDEIKALGIRIFRRDDDGPFVATWATVDEPESRIAAPTADDELVEVRTALRCPPSHQRWYLRAYQNDAYFTLLQAVRAGTEFLLDASDAGLGKTWNALEVVRQLGINFGVVCPANVVTKWTNTAIDMPFQLEPEFVLSYDKLRSGRTDYVSRTQRVYRKKNITEFEWNTCDRVALIFDEIHVCAGQDSLNAKLLRAAIDNPHCLILGCSATACNSPLDMKTIGYGLELHKLADWFQWCKRMGCRPGPFGGLIFNTGMNGKRAPTTNQLRARRKLQEIHHHIFPKRGTRIQKALIADQLPENLIMADTINLAEDDKRIQTALDEIDAKEEADEEKAYAKEHAVSDLTLNTRARQRTELMKLPGLYEKIVALRAEGNSVIVFLNYSKSIELLGSWLKEPFARVVGCFRDDETFQSNEKRIILCQTEAGSASIDLDDTDGNFPRCSLISPGYSARQLIQALGRPHRGPTTKSKVMQWILFAAATVEEHACRIVQHKLNNIGLINDGDLAGVMQLV